MFRTAALILVLIARVAVAAPLFDDAWPADSFLPRTTPLAAGFFPPLVNRVVNAAAKTDSASLILARDGKVFVERAFGKPTGPILQFSVSKSICSLAIGILIHEGKIGGVDAPLSTWFPEFAEGQKAKVTLKHVLTHTTGIKHFPEPNALVVAPDRLAYVLNSPLTDEPGKVFSYSNEACQLLSGIIERSAGKPADAFIEERLFAPLGITGATWDRDQVGNVCTFGGCHLEPRQLFRIGEMMLANGAYQGKQVVPAAWVLESTRPAGDDVPTCGYLWWIQRAGTIHRVTKDNLDALKVAGFDGTARLRVLTGLPFPSATFLWKAMLVLLTEKQRLDLWNHYQNGRSPFEDTYGRVIGYSANGLFGQYLAVYPKKRVLAVRHRRWVANEPLIDTINNSFAAIFEELETLLGAALW